MQNGKIRLTKFWSRTNTGSRLFRIVSLCRTNILTFAIVWKNGSGKKSKEGDGVKVTLSADEVNAVRVALIIYGDVLMDVHRGKIKKELKMVIAKAIVEAEKEDSKK